MAVSQRTQVRELTAAELDAAARYSYRVWWSNEDGVFLAEAAELEGTTIDGTSPKSALQNAIEAAAMWLVAATEDGTVLPRPIGHEAWKARMTVAAAPR